MYWLGIRQDLFIKKEGKISRIKIVSPALVDNRRLSNYCPMGLNVAREINSPRCIHCLYCYFVDKKNALKLEGEFNHLHYQIKKYKPLIEKIAAQE